MTYEHLRFYFEPTSYCQLKCPLCPTPKFGESRQGYMDIGQFQKLVVQANHSGLVCRGDDFHFYGFGEPTLHPHLDEMVSLSTSFGITSKINTNGIDMDQNMWEKMKKAGLTKALISVDGITEADYKKYRRGGNWQRVLDNVTYACSHKGKIEIEVQMILFKHNVDHEQDFIDWAREVGADVAVIKKPRLWEGSINNYKGMRNLPPIAQRDRGVKSKKKFEERGAVLYNGDLTISNSDPYGRFKVGNIFDKGPELWFSEQFEELKQKSIEENFALQNNDLYVKKVLLWSVCNAE